MKCTVRQLESLGIKWLIIETEEIAILQKIDEEVFEIPESVNIGEIFETEEGYDFQYFDKHNFRVSHERIDREEVEVEEYIQFCQEFGSNNLTKKFNNYFNLKNKKDGK